MPLEIRELIIRTQIVSQDGRQSERNGSQQSQLNVKELVNQCVNKIMDLLEKEKER